MLQKIFFGPPGCGKSYRVRQEAEDKLGIVGKNNPNMVETTFHPEYSYGDFIAKLLPQKGLRKLAYVLEGHSVEIWNGTTLTQNVETPTIEYVIHAGPLIKALARAYAKPEQNVLLAIDEINRGNCAQIFGDIFQLLDRKDDGWSEYGIDLSRLTLTALEQELQPLGKTLESLPPQLRIEDEHKKIVGYKLRLPPTLSIIGTMNTSDESVYYMDTAFKRRWDFEYMSWQGTADTPKWQQGAVIKDSPDTWQKFLQKLNAFIAEEFRGRNVDDKQVGIWFLKAMHPVRMALRTKLERLRGNELKSAWMKEFPSANGNDSEPLTPKFVTENVAESIKEISKKPYPDLAAGDAKEIADKLIKYLDTLDANELIGERKITHDTVKNKLMFFLWDNVFSRDREPLERLINPAKKLRTFGEFASEENVTAFIKGVEKLSSDEAVPQ